MACIDKGILKKQAPQIQIQYVDLPLQDIFKTSAQPEIQWRYNLDALLPYAWPHDGSYMQTRTSLEGLMYQYSSIVGINFKEAEFKNQKQLCVSLAPCQPIYFGLLHAHTADSDGLGSPQEAFEQARDVAHLDFYAITDHSEYWLFDNRQAWNNQHKISLQVATPEFLPLVGFEYSNTFLGHYVVIGTDEYVNSFEMPTLTGFYDWLSDAKQENALAIFAHPGFHKNRSQTDFLKFEFNLKASNKLIGLEVIHAGMYKPYLKGFDNKISYYDLALQRGWLPGAIAAQDSHNGNGGIQDAARIGVSMPELTQKALMNGLRNRNFYATQNESLLLAMNAQKKDGSWVNMGAHLKEQDIAHSGLPFKVRYAQPHQNKMPYKFEVMVNGEQKGSMQFYFQGSHTALEEQDEVFENSLDTEIEQTDSFFWQILLKKILPKGGLFAFLGKQKEFRMTENLIPEGEAGEFSFLINPSLFNRSELNAVYVRLYQGKKGKYYTQTSPVFIQKD